ncbi:MAG: DUF1015 family protein [Clostridia bacterium]|nr:DUF1015 family protein [Clostridia bacterium]
MPQYKEIFKAADILLPDRSESFDYYAYPVIACDQHTSEPEYWHETERITNGKISTLNLIIPEIYLDKAEDRLPSVHASMEEYESNALHEYRNTVVFCERTQRDGRIRQGAVCALDLECYDYKEGSTPYVRATEGTVLSRIPARLKVRREALLELPHVMLLINDPDNSVIEPEFSNTRNMRAIYDTDLMQNGGHIKGYIPGSGGAFFLRRLNELASKCDKQSFSVAVGDGNHSLATAKAMYEELKESIGVEAAADHPARYALVEIVNIYSPALDFEPIHRIVYGIDCETLCNKAREYLKAIDCRDVRYLDVTSSAGRARLPVSAEKELTVAALTDFLDSLCSLEKGIDVDYIHGDEALARLSVCNAVGIYCEKLDKSELFSAVGKDDPLPRKTFSMGHAEDKRYYLEARRIKY